MDKKVIDVLTGKIKEYFKPGQGGRKFSYVKGEDVISRLNLAFEHEWSSRVEDVKEVDNQIIVLVSIEACGVTHHGFGGAEVFVHRDGPKKGKPVDISNSYKSAYTNALKKAAEQFGVGLQSEDSFTAPAPKPVPTHTAPPAPAAAPSGPVSGSATFKTAKPAQTASPPQDLQALMANVDMTALQKQVQSMLANAPAPTPAPAPAPAPKAEPETLAKSFQDKPAASEYNPEETRQPEVASPFPATPADAPLNDFQLNALSGLAKMKKVTPDSAINMGLPGSTKTKYEELTKDEAKAVIQALNGLEG